MDSFERMVNDGPMVSVLVGILEANDNDSSEMALSRAVPSLSLSSLLAEREALEVFWRESRNVYQKVRALFFLYALHRFHLPRRNSVQSAICPVGYAALLDRRFEDAIDCFLKQYHHQHHQHHQYQQPHLDCHNDSAPLLPARTCLISTLGRVESTTTTSPTGHLTTSSTTSSPTGHLTTTSHVTTTSHLTTTRHVTSPTASLLPSEADSSALAKAYRSLAFQILADQVRHSVRAHPGNEWMFDCDTEPGNGFLQWHPHMIPTRSTNNDTLPILLERTPVRMDISHSCWSDIFFLGMDYPQGARVINCSIDLAVQTNDTASSSLPIPPIECRLQLTTNHPGTIQLTSIDLGTSVILTHVSQIFQFASDYLGLLKAGIVASGILPLKWEKRCAVQDIPIRQVLLEMMPPHLRNDCPYGLELVTNVHNIPKGSRLAVSTNLLGSIIAICMRATNQTASLTGPLLEVERRLVAARAILGEWLGGSGGGWQDSGGLWPGWKLIHGVQSSLGDPEYGSSRGRLLPNHHLLNEEEAPPSLLEALEKSLVLVHGGMAQNVGPILEMVTEKYLLREEDEWQARLRAMEILDELLLAFRDSDVKRIAKLVTENFFGPIRTVVPWATNAYTERVIERVQATFGEQFWGFWMLGGMSGGGMGFIFDPDCKQEASSILREIMLKTKREMQHSLPFAMDPVVFNYKVNEIGTTAELLENHNAIERMDHIDGRSIEKLTLTQNLEELLREQGFDMAFQDRVRIELQSGVIGLQNNRLACDSIISDVTVDDVLFANDMFNRNPSVRDCGWEALSLGAIGVVTLAAGVGSRWTQGAGVVKAIHPFCCLGGRHRTFIEVHLAKNLKVSRDVGMPIPHVFTTSWMTHDPIHEYIESINKSVHGSIYVSKGCWIGRRMIPTVRDLKFLWQEQSHQRLDEQAQKVQDSLHTALMCWAQSSGEGSDYSDNVPNQCLCPMGHWYEVPNLLLNGTLAKMLRERPQLHTLMVHNIDTVGADVDADILGMFLESGSVLAFEVVPRCIEDMGGGLCRVNGKARMVEGLAFPREDDELKLSYYNSLTTWVNINGLLQLFGLDRHDIIFERMDKIKEAVNQFSWRLPTYVTIKEVKKRWGNGQEDIHPVAQLEKLWGDMSILEDVKCSYFVVSRQRGQQLKHPAQLDEWSRDGGAAYLDSICSWK